MSIWTQVNGQIRLDKFYGEPEPDLGKMAIFTVNTHGEDARKMLSECEVPCGSEGSLRWKFHKNVSSNSVCWGYISIDGDLRDYDNVNEIVEWLNNYIKGRVVRQGVLQVQTGLKVKFISYNHDSGVWAVI